MNSVPGDTSPVSRCHFTYEPPRGVDLHQGDLIRRTALVEAILQEVHPHYTKSDYTHLLVLTQSCDLVRRSGKCSARYVSVCAVRPINLVIKRALATYQEPIQQAAEIASKRHRDRLREFVIKLLNNNQKDYFFLKAEPDLDFGEDACAFLALSIALKASEHFDTLLNARILSMAEIFRAKLGWLVGNMYSRVGTPDWVPDHASKTEFAKVVDNIVDAACKWVADEQLKQAHRDAPEDVKSDAKRYREHVMKFTIRSKKERAVEAVVLALVRGGLLAELQQQTAENLLRMDPGFSGLLKDG